MGKKLYLLSQILVDNQVNDPSILPLKKVQYPQRRNRERRMKKMTLVPIQADFLFGNLDLNFKPTISCY